MPSCPHSPSACTAAPQAEEFWDNRFHWCALAAGFIAAIEGKLRDSYYVRDLAYRMYEEGAFKDSVLAQEVRRQSVLAAGTEGEGASLDFIQAVANKGTPA